MIKDEHVLKMVKIFSSTPDWAKYGDDDESMTRLMYINYSNGGGPLHEELTTT